MLQEKTNSYLLFGFLSALFLLGVWIHNDYGIAWDDPIQRTVGHINWQYVTGEDSNNLMRFRDRYYGPVVELLLVAVEKGLQLTTPSRIFQMRHFVVFLFYLMTCLLVWLLLRRLRPSSVVLPWVGLLFFVLSPRLFSHGFYNTKDIPFLAFFSFSMFAMIRLMERKTWPNALLLGLATGLTAGIRIPGLLAWGVALPLLVVEAWHENQWKKMATLTFGAGIFCIVVIYAVYPVLWANPIQELGRMLDMMKNFPWPSKTFYAGQYYGAGEMPWHYLFVWFSITTPLVYLFLLFCGAVCMGSLVVRRPRDLWREHRLELVCLLWIVLPLSIVVVRRVTVYDAWRHFFFLYPAAIVLMVRGVAAIGDVFQSRPMLRRTVYGVLAINVMVVAGYMVAYHPLQCVYFNRLAGANLQDVKARYDIDYWGISFRKAYAYIAANDKRPRIRVHPSNYSGMNNSFTLPEKERKRFMFVQKLKHADYLISNYRHHPKEYPFPKKKIFYRVRIDGANVLVVYKFR